MDRYNLQEIQWPDTPFSLNEHLVLLCRRGSEAHGTYVPSVDPNSIDDKDVFGVVVPPMDYYLGMKKWEGADSIKGPWDVVLYEFKKFVDLLCKQNPNVIGMLWLEDEDYLKATPVGRMLVDNRNLFINKKLFFKSFVGYAHGQLHHMENSACKGYMGDKRKQLVEKYGFDCKNAAHLIRLLKMGIEFLETGVLHVRRTHDRDQLVDIKKGRWTLE